MELWEDDEKKEAISYRRGLLWGNYLQIRDLPFTFRELGRGILGCILCYFSAQRIRALELEQPEVFPEDQRYGEQILGKGRFFGHHNFSTSYNFL